MRCCGSQKLSGHPTQACRIFGSTSARRAEGVRATVRRRAAATLPPFAEGEPLAVQPVWGSMSPRRHAKVGRRIDCTAVCRVAHVD